MSQMMQSVVHIEQQELQQQVQGDFCIQGGLKHACDIVAGQ
jgi:hypothetical protein